MVDPSRQPGIDDPAGRAGAPTKVLFLAGKGRSGGTLLANLLGQVPGFFNVGELNRLWDWGLVSNYKCGCGVPVRDCPTWNAILEHADSLLEGTDLVPLKDARVDLDQAAVATWRRMPRLLVSRVDKRERWKALQRYTTASSAVYRSIAVVTGARVVADSSRLPIEPVGLGLVPDVEVSIGQLVRDPRAVVYSWKRTKDYPDRDTDEQMPKYSASFSTASWFVRNVVVEYLRRKRPSITVQYDALARDPAAVLRDLADLVGEPAGDLEFLASETANIIPTHNVGGNPGRMTSGAVVIKPDDEWRRSISGRDRAVSTVMALPLLHRYGFPIRSAPRGSQ